MAVKFLESPTLSGLVTHSFAVREEGMHHELVTHSFAFVRKEGVMSPKSVCRGGITLCNVVIVA